MDSRFPDIVDFMRDHQPSFDETLDLHRPFFIGDEKKLLLDCIDSTFVSSVGNYVDRFEEQISAYTGALRAVAVVNGTAALHLALVCLGVKPGDEVITQAVGFVATANAIAYCGASPVFLDSDAHTLGLCPVALERFLSVYTRMDDSGHLINIQTGRRIAGCVPMHVFGHPVDMDTIVAVCGRFGIPIVEDAAESLGSLFRGQHTGTFGRMGIFSFNGNKIITTGGGGIVVTEDPQLGDRLKHFSTTARISHAWEFQHDEIGYNYRLPNLNAALGCAQMERLGAIVDKKRALARAYSDFFATMDVEFMHEPNNARSNYWLNAVCFKDRSQRDSFLAYSNRNGIMVRPLWTLLSELPMYRRCQNDGLLKAHCLAERIVNIPSSVAA